MTKADKAIRWSTTAAVVVVAAVAASVSYRHALGVVGHHGESGWIGDVCPLTIDGTIYAASMLPLNDARRGLKPHWLAYGALGLGISTTLAVNVAAGLAYGLGRRDRGRVARSGARAGALSHGRPRPPNRRCEPPEGSPRLLSGYSQSGDGAYQTVPRQLVKHIVNRYRSNGPGINDLLDACPNRLGVDADCVANEVVWGTLP